MEEKEEVRRRGVLQRDGLEEGGKLGGREAGKLF